MAATEYFNFHYRCRRLFQQKSTGFERLWIISPGPIPALSLNIKIFTEESVYSGRSVL